MADPFTIRIFVPDGDPEGIRIIDRMNWTGAAISFPRSKWSDVSNRSEFNKIGVYILSGYQEGEEDIPTFYIGQADGLKYRLDSHYKNKDFWDTGIIFYSTNDGLNRAHVTWLEYALIKTAKSIGRCNLDNGNVPQEPSLTEAEKADTKAFLKEILQILPLLNVRVFEPIKAVATPKVTIDQRPNKVSKSVDFDTIVVPAQEEGFKKVFLGENSWYSIRISAGKLDDIRYIAAYQTNPVAAITHYAPVDRIEPYGDGGKYRLFFSAPAQKIGPIPYADAPKGSMQSTRYTTLEKLKNAKKLSDIF